MAAASTKKYIQNLKDYTDYLQSDERHKPWKKMMANKKKQEKKKAERGLYLYQEPPHEGTVGTAATHTQTDEQQSQFGESQKPQIIS